MQYIKCKVHGVPVRVTLCCLWSVIMLQMVCSIFFQMITREMFEDALKDLQDDGVIIVMGKSTLRVC